MILKQIFFFQINLYLYNKKSFLLYVQNFQVKFNIMSTKTKQKKMAEFVTSKKVETKKRPQENDDNKSEAKKSKPGQVDLTTINFDCDKKNGHGKTWNLKIVSWNVAGIRAWVKVKCEILWIFSL